MQPLGVLVFLLTCLLRGMTIDAGKYTATLNVSTHMPLARHDYSILETSYSPYCFYSHASCEAWPFEEFGKWQDKSFYSHASCEAWRRGFTQRQFRKVSTHMPLARHDINENRLSSLSSVSTHMPLARHDVFSVVFILFIVVSTHMPLARHDPWIQCVCKLA